METMWFWQALRVVAREALHQVQQVAAGKLRVHRLVCDACYTERSGWAATELGAFQLAELEGWLVRRTGAREICCPSCAPHVHDNVKPLRRVG